MSHPPVLASPRLAAAQGVRHGFFMRHGGVSRGVYASLNVGLGSNDDDASVLENRRRAAGAFGVDASSLVTCHQIHSSVVGVAHAAWDHAGRPRADGVATAAPGLLCGALAADCAPVLIADPHAGVVAAIHAGWRGALEGVIEAGVARMAGLGADPGRMIAAVGPCIGPASYEVGLEFEARFLGADPAYGRFFNPGAAADKRQFDLPAFVLARLARAGVDNAEWIGRDTCDEEANFFSHRRGSKSGDADYGRLLSVIMLS